MIRYNKHLLFLEKQSHIKNRRPGLRSGIQGSRAKPANKITFNSNYFYQTNLDKMFCMLLD